MFNLCDTGVQFVRRALFSFWRRSCSISPTLLFKFSRRIQTHVMIALGRALCISGYRVAFRTAIALATELEVAHKELRLPRLLAQYRRYDLVLIDE